MENKQFKILTHPAKAINPSLGSGVTKFSGFRLRRNVYLVRLCFSYIRCNVISIYVKFIAI